MPRVLGDHELTLRSGRRVGFTLYGDAHGIPVVNCHGGLLSGHDVGPADGDARSLGLCVISPTGPGWAAPTAFPVMDCSRGYTPIWYRSSGTSASRSSASWGGQKAVSTPWPCAFALGVRVVRCAVVAGCLPLDDRATFKQLNRLDRSLIGLSKHAPVATRAYFTLTRMLSRHAPKVLLRQAVKDLPADEARAVTERGRWLPTLLGEGAANSRGGVDEYLAMSAPWGFAPEDIAIPVHVFQGEADALVPAAWGRGLARRVPGPASPAIQTRGTSSR